MIDVSPHRVSDTHHAGKPVAVTTGVSGPKRPVRERGAFEKTEAGMRLNKLLAVFLGLPLALVDLPTGPAGAATATTTFLVTANIAVSCTITATDLDFGDYANAQLDGQSQITVTCTNTATWNVGLNAGTCTGATVTTRCMTGPGAAALNYSLSSDATRIVNWGNTVGTDTVSGTGTGGPEIITVYGRIPAGQTTAPAGGYTDTITAEITF
jgi:spore coat protein U domain-containing protein, fimbrial subunit CupE1/2/3/6